MLISQSYIEISLYRNRIARKGKNPCCEILFQTAFYLNIYFIFVFPHFLKFGTQFVMYYKLRCNSTQFVIYYKLRNYYKLQRNRAHVAKFYGRLRLIRSDWEHQNFFVFKLFEIEILLDYYTIFFVFARLEHVFSPFVNTFWIRITDEGSVPKMRIWSI